MEQLVQQRSIQVRRAAECPKQVWVTIRACQHGEGIRKNTATG